MGFPSLNCEGITRVIDIKVNLNYSSTMGKTHMDKMVYSDLDIVKQAPLIFITAKFWFLITLSIGISMNTNKFNSGHH